MNKIKIINRDGEKLVGIGGEIRVGDEKKLRLVSSGREGGIGYLLLIRHSY